MATKPRVVIPVDNPMQIGESLHLERLRAVADVELHSAELSGINDQLARAGKADVLINSRGHIHWSRELLAQLPRLKMITTCSIGTDAIDLVAAPKSRGRCFQHPGRTAPVVAEHALCLILAAARRVAFHTHEIKQGRWAQRYSMFLSGKTLGIIGTGSIGACLAKLAKAIGMRVVAWTFNPSEERAAELGVDFVEFDQLFRQSDVVSVHVKLTDQSRDLVGDREIKLMKPGSLLVNTARGPVVNRRALVSSLQSGHLGGAGVDVFDEEPVQGNDPLINCDQVVLTPHNADQTPEGMDFLNGGAVDNVLAFLAGKPQNVVN